MKYTCHSGGCPGADMFWEDEGNKYGITTIAYSFWGHTQEGKNRKILERPELDEGFEHVKIASRGIGRNPNPRWPYVKNLISRNWFQVKNAESIFAVGKFLGTERKLVSGGTGWAVQMAIDNKKETFLFDQENNNWNKYNYTTNQFDVIDYIPKLTENFAGIGTRELQENGREAIREIYKNSFHINTDLRYLKIKERLNLLSIEQLLIIIDNIDLVCFDTFNYDENTNKFCPLAIALNLHITIENPTDKLITKEISKQFNPVNVIKGIDGKFYKDNRKEDLLYVCNELIKEKRILG